jgi:ketosteroid isomerase-like protein
MRCVSYARWVLLGGAYVGLILGVVGAETAGAQAPIARRGKEPAMAETAVERTLFALEEDWTRALVRRDVATFDRLLALQFVYTENDQVMTKDELIRAVVSGPDTVESAGNEDMRAYVYGNTAVVTGWLVMRGRGASGPFNRRFRYTDTWLYRDGRWRVIAAHDYLVPDRR